MASLFQKPNSKYWWVKYRGPDGVIRRESTKLRVGIANETRSAEVIRAEKSLDEIKTNNSGYRGAFDTWVGQWFLSKYSDRYQVKTLERYQAIWSTFKIFLRERKITHPCQFTRDHCFDYLKWREQPDLPAGRHTACHNTALMDIKIFSMIMSEAVRRGYIQENPCLNLGIKKHRVAEKPELTREDITEIREKIQLEKDPEHRNMLEVSFEIALHQGCRQSETHMPLSAFDLDAMVVHYPRTKQNPSGHTSPLNPKLAPLIKRLKSEGREMTFIMPVAMSRSWWNFLKKHRFTERNICFHCTRVTVITAMARNNVPEYKAQKFIGHASTLIHRIYQRLRVEDLSSCTDHLDF